jgi:hypothetical protein
MVGIKISLKTQSSSIEELHEHIQILGPEWNTTLLDEESWINWTRIDAIQHNQI